MEIQSINDEDRSINYPQRCQGDKQSRWRNTERQIEKITQRHFLCLDRFVEVAKGLFSVGNRCILRDSVFQNPLGNGIRI